MIYILHALVSTYTSNNSQIIIIKKKEQKQSIGSAYRFNYLYRFIYSLHLSVRYFVVFEIFYIFLYVVKEGKSGKGLFQEGATKGNRFDAGLTSHTTLHHSFQRKIPISFLARSFIKL